MDRRAEPDGLVVFEVGRPRVPERMLSILVWTTFIVGFAALTFELTQWMRKGLPPWPTWQIAYLVLLGVSMIGWMAWRSRPGRLRPDVVFGPDAVSVPRSRFASRSRVLRYDEILSSSAGWPRSFPSINIAAKRHWHTVLREHWFTQPDALGLIDAELRARLEAMPDGAARLVGSDRRARAALASTDARPVLTIGLLVINSLIAVLQWRAGGFDDSFELFREGANHWWLLSDGGWYRLFVASFLHAAWWHYAVNVFSLAMIGPLVEGTLGRWRFTIVLLAGMLGGAIATSQAGWAPSVGFSLGIYALLGAVLALNLLRRHDLPPPLNVPPTVAVLLLVYPAMSALAFARIDQVGHSAAFGAGALACLLVLPGLDLEHPRRAPGSWLRAVATGLVALYVAGFVQGARFVATADARTIRTIALRNVEDPRFDHDLAMLVGVEIAMAEDSTRVELASIWRAIQGIVEHHQDVMSYQSVLATLEYRLGHLARAAARERHVDGLSPLPVHCALLARFEHARLQEKRGAPPNLAAVASEVRVEVGPGPRPLATIAIEVDRAFPHGAALEVLVESSGALLGLIRVASGPLTPGQPLVVGLPTDAPQLPDHATVSLAHAEHRRGSEPRWRSEARYCGIDPLVAALPSWRASRGPEL